jgi:hypothetical protein
MRDNNNKYREMLISQLIRNHKDKERRNQNWNQPIENIGAIIKCQHASFQIEGAERRQNGYIIYSKW